MNDNQNKPKIAIIGCGPHGRTVANMIIEKDLGIPTERINTKEHGEYNPFRNEPMSEFENPFLSRVFTNPYIIEKMEKGMMYQATGDNQRKQPSRKAKAVKKAKKKASRKARRQNR